MSERIPPLQDVSKSIINGAVVNEHSPYRIFFAVSLEWFCRSLGHNHFERMLYLFYGAFRLMMTWLPQITWRGLIKAQFKVRLDD